MTTAQAKPGPVQVTGEVLGLRRVGEYQVLTLTAPGIPEATRPGHFVALAVGGPSSSMLLRRAFSIHNVQSRGVYGGTVEVVFATAGDGTLVTVRHRGFAALRKDHPTRHGLDDVAFARSLGLWWGDQLGSLREFAAAQPAP